MTITFTPACKEITVTKYVAADGTKFDTKAECVQHEARNALSDLFGQGATYGELDVSIAVGIVENNADLVRAILAATGK